MERKIINMILPMAAAIVLVCCGVRGEMDIPGHGEKVPVGLSVALGPDSRSTVFNWFEVGDTVGVYAYTNPSSPRLYPDFMYNQPLICKSVNRDDILAEWTYSPVKYFPVDNTPVRFYAAYPYSKDSTFDPVDGPVFRWDLDGSMDILVANTILMEGNKTYLDGSLTSAGPLKFYFRHALMRVSFMFWTDNLDGSMVNMIVDNVRLKNMPRFAEYRPAVSTVLSVDYSDMTDTYVITNGGQGFKIYGNTNANNTRSNLLLPPAVGQIPFEFDFGGVTYTATVTDEVGWLPATSVEIMVLLSGSVLKPEISVSAWATTDFNAPDADGEKAQIDIERNTEMP